MLFKNLSIGIIFGMCALQAFAMNEEWYKREIAAGHYPAVLRAYHLQEAQRRYGIDPQSVNAVDKNSYITPLYSAVEEDNLDLAKFLLEHGAQATINNVDCKGRSALCVASCRTLCDQFVPLLLMHGAEVDFDFSRIHCQNCKDLLYEFRNRHLVSGIERLAFATMLHPRCSSNADGRVLTPHLLRAIADLLLPRSVINPRVTL